MAASEPIFILQFGHGKSSSAFKPPLPAKPITLRWRSPATKRTPPICWWSGVGFCWRSHCLSLQSTQGLVLCVGLEVQWKLRCDAKYEWRGATLDDFIALWCSIFETWKGEKKMSCISAGLHHLIA